MNTKGKLTGSDIKIDERIFKKLHDAAQAYPYKTLQEILSNIKNSRHLVKTILLDKETIIENLSELGEFMGTMQNIRNEKDKEEIKCVFTRTDQITEVCLDDDEKNIITIGEEELLMTEITSKKIFFIKEALEEDQNKSLER